MSWTQRLRRRGAPPASAPVTAPALADLRDEDLTDDDRAVLATAYDTYARTAQAARDEDDPVVAQYIATLAERVRHKGEETLSEIATQRLAIRSSATNPIEAASFLGTRDTPDAPAAPDTPVTSPALDATEDDEAALLGVVIQP